MLPYIHIKDLSLGPLTLHPFGVLVAIGVIVGTYLATWRARKRGIDLVRLNSFVTWMLIAGFIGGHVLDTIFYHPQKVLTDPLSLLRLWEGLSSFGGFVGALVGIGLWKYFEVGGRGKDEGEGKGDGDGERKGGWIRRRERPEAAMPFMDLILSVFPVAWIFGRSGCSVVHDHPGAIAEPGALLSVAYPGPGQRPEWTSFVNLYHGSVHRYDLGLMELAFTVVLAALLALTWHRKLPTGTYIVVVCLSYAPVRFVMDRLRITEGDSADPRYGGLTPAQWACVALFVTGVGTALWMRRLSKQGVDLTDRILASP